MEKSGEKRLRIPMEFEDFRGFWLFGMAPLRILPLDFDMAPESR